MVILSTNRDLTSYFTSFFFPYAHDWPEESVCDRQCWATEPQPCTRSLSFLFPYFSDWELKRWYYSIEKVDTIVLFLTGKKKKDFSFPVWCNLGPSFVEYNLLQWVVFLFLVFSGLYHQGTLNFGQSSLLHLVQRCGISVLEHLCSPLHLLIAICGTSLICKEWNQPDRSLWYF